MVEQKPDAAKLRVTLCGIDPAPWREVDVPLSMTFLALHHTIQAAFLWHNSHLWEFQCDGTRYGIPFEDDDFSEARVREAKNARLIKLRDKNITEFSYTYDFGDDWRHRLEVLEFFGAPKGSRLPCLTGGEWRCPPEDCGGPFGFPDFLEAIENPKHENHADLIEWNGGPFDRRDMDMEVVEVQMKRLSGMRRPKR